jgi:hypothetical protein
MVSLALKRGIKKLNFNVLPRKYIYFELLAFMYSWNQKVILFDQRENFNLLEFK